MKKLTTCFGVIILSFVLFGTVQAQFVKAGAGIMYGSEIEKIGIRVDGVYQITDEFRGVADLGIFFPDKTDLGGGDEYTLTWWELNLNGNYMFYVDDTQGLAAYALGGLNIATLRSKWEGSFGDDTESNTEVGLNIGAGVEYALDFADLFGELKFVLGDADQLNIGVGLRIPIGQ